MNKEKIFSAAKAAKVIGFSAQYTRRLCAQGKIKAEKMGTTWLIRESSLRGLEKRLKSDVKQEV